MTQLVASPQSQININNYSNQLEAVLKDIVNQVEIRADFSVRHPDYKPLELIPEAITRFQKMPEQMQQKYLSLQLQSFLYGIYYSGSMRQALALDAEDNKLLLDLENNTVLGIDLEFYNRIHTSNNGQGYFEPGWSILKEEEDGSLVVRKGKNGLKLYIERDKHLQPNEQDAVVGDTVAIKMPKNCVQNGFYVSVGNARADLHRDAQEESILVRIYFNLTPDGAVAVMGSLTQQLNEQNIPFDFKVLYNPQDYQRHDSGVLYFDKSNYELVHQVLQQVYQENQSHFKAEVPLFTLQLAPGLALAEEPNQKFAERESFGMNRCQIIANGLLEAWNQGKNLPDERIQAIFEQFSLAGIDLNHTYLNADSKDIYLGFDL
jgi:HopA1 effector protein family